MAKSTQPVIGFLDEGIVPSSTQTLLFTMNVDGQPVMEQRSFKVFELSDFIDEVYGTAAADAIFAWAGDDKVNGGAGDDYIDGGAGSDQLYGGDGNDQLRGGDGTDMLSGNAGDDVLDGGAGADSLLGGSGNDLYRVYGQADWITEYAGQGTDTVMTDLASWTLGANLENLFAEPSKLAGAQLTGNALNNRISGGLGNDTLSGLDGNDVLDGSGGADSMVGGKGNDSYRIDHAGDIVVELAGEGTDSVIATFSHALGANFENLYFEDVAGQPVKAYGGIGNALANVLVGASGNDTLQGLEGNDYLSGGAGVDAMAGGTGDDIYDVDSLADQTIEASSAGIDSVRTSLANYTLQANIEKLDFVVGVAPGGGVTTAVRFTGTGNASGNTITGWSLEDTLRGGAGNDTLRGGDGNDSLDGGADHDRLEGGAGADAMSGGTGNDTYVVDSVSDQVIEATAAGLDTVQTTLLTHTLAPNVEVLQFTGSGVFTGIGNASANFVAGGVSNDMLYGREGNDTLSGGAGNDWMDGGTGIDSMLGGSGNDTYIVDSLDEIITEYAGGGTDTVWVSASKHVLAENVENLVVTGTVPSQNYGNALNNAMSGGVSADTLSGSAGNDTLKGGGANDYLNGGIGNDLLQGDTGGDWLDGGAGNDLLQGGDGNDFLAASMGSDVLTGGAGNDRFGLDVFDKASIDRVTDFVKGQDRIDLTWYDAVPGTPAYDPMTFVFQGQFSGGGRGSVRYEWSGTQTVVQADFDGDAVLDAQMALDGTMYLGMADFVFSV